MKKSIRLCLIAVAVIVFSSAAASAGYSYDSYSWYFCQKKDYQRPSSPSEASFYIKYDAHYLGADEKVVYLTFDVGYENGNVEKVADIIKKHNVTAAFFTLPHFLRKNQELVKRLKDDGNLICNHTYSHKDMSKYTSFEEFESELTKIEKLYSDLYGCEMSKFYRPPEGRFSEANLAWAQKMDYTTVFWSVAYADWDDRYQPDLNKAIQKLIKRTHNGAVILLHPTSSTNAAILEDYILYLKENGYRFGSVRELCQANSGAGSIIPSNGASDGKIMCKNAEAKKKLR